jgi:hypothetical protein
MVSAAKDTFSWGVFGFSTGYTAFDTIEWLEFL